MQRLEAIGQIGVTEQTYFRWKKNYGGMGTSNKGTEAAPQRVAIPRNFGAINFRFLE